MASALYTQCFIQYQGLVPGQSRTIGFQSTPESITVVFTDIAVYCGNPDATAPNSIVITSQFAEGAQPTIWAYDSGITSSTNPIFIHDSGRWAFFYIPQDPNPVFFAQVVNTGSTLIGGGTWDVSITGWVLRGQSGLTMNYE